MYGHYSPLKSDNMSDTSGKRHHVSYENGISHLYSSLLILIHLCKQFQYNQAAFTIRELRTWSRIFLVLIP